MHRLFLIMCALLLAQVAGADTIGYGDSIPLQATNWTKSVTVPKFDPALGTLTGIDFYLTGHVEGNAKFESLDAKATTVTMNLKATITLKRPDMSTLVVVIPVVSTSDGVTAFDGVIDFGGTSGRAYLGLMANQSDSASSPPPASDLALFTASFAGETITLPAIATGNSEGSGAGNLLLVFSTSASADVRVVYTYDPIPEPSGLLAIMTGLVGMAGAVRIRRR